MSEALINGIFAGATSTDARQGEYSPEEYLNLVEDLTDKELQIARTIYTLQRDISPTELESGNMAETWRLCKEEIGKIRFVLRAVSRFSCTDLLGFSGLP